MKWTKKHYDALETCKDALRKNYPLGLWVAFGIEPKDRLIIISIAKKSIAKEKAREREPDLFN